ncbi:hypothetical protein ACFLZ3_04810 [Candidatus Omnitrophota bacterium]
MADQVKEGKGCEGKSALGRIIKVIFGLLFLVFGLLAVLRWFPDLLSVVRGSLGPFLIIAGIITLAIAKE